MSEDQIHYPPLIDQAMRTVVREVLKQVSESGLPGDHHFYISFNTTHPGVKISDALRARYPKEITVVLQHQFWDFSVDDKMFNVTLSFGGVPEKLAVPFAAMTAFADPSVKFGLQFQQANTPPAVGSFAIEEIAVGAAAEKKEKDAPAEIFSLDAFRKK